MRQPDLTVESSAKGFGLRTAQRAVEMLIAHDARYHCPSRGERDTMLVGFAKHRKVLYGAAFDVIRTERPIDLLDPDAIAGALDDITICEVKSTNRTIASDVRGYFFNITAAELLTAQSVGERFRFVFVNTLTGEHQEMALNDGFGRARAMYPAWHIRF